MAKSRGQTIEDLADLADLAEALFDILEEENVESPDLNRAIVEALAHQNMFNIELVSALSAVAEGGSPEAELDSLVLNMNSVHKSLVRAISAWTDGPDAT